MGLLSKSQILGLLLLLALVVPIDVIPNPVHGLIRLAFVISIGYFIFWWISGLVRAPKSFQKGRREVKQPTDRKHEE